MIHLLFTYGLKDLLCHNKLSALIFSSYGGFVFMSFLTRLWYKITPLYRGAIYHQVYDDISKSYHASYCYSYRRRNLVSEFISALKIAISKAGNTATTSSSILRNCLNMLNIESDIYNQLSDLYVKFLQNSTCNEELTSYTDFIMVNSIMSNIPVFVSAILPYFMINHDILDLPITIYTKHLQNSNDGNRVDFIKAKLDEIRSIYKKTIDDTKNIMKNFTEEQPPIVLLKMEETFLHSAVLNWHFVDEIYREYKSILQNTNAQQLMMA